MEESRILRRLLRLGGEMERASQARDYQRLVDTEHEITSTGSLLSEDYAWWLTVIRGRNVIRRNRGIEEMHY